MRYDNIVEAKFIDRPNRFIANAITEDGPVVCHVKNTGRCRELLIPGARIFLRHCPSPARKTEYDLISVYKGGRLINMDAAAPNAAFLEYARAGHFLPDMTSIRPETVHGDSRFDFYCEAGAYRCFAEVKGVTLEEENTAYFPDAPTVRGVKHLRGLIRCVEEGYDAYAVFIVQMRGVRLFRPNRATHPEFADALRDAAAAGVHLMALGCDVTEDSMTIAEKVDIELD